MVACKINLFLGIPSANVLSNLPFLQTHIMNLSAKLCMAEKEFYLSNLQKSDIKGVYEFSYVLRFAVSFQ